MDVAILAFRDLELDAPSNMTFSFFLPIACLSKSKRITIFDQVLFLYMLSGLVNDRFSV